MRKNDCLVCTKRPRAYGSQYCQLCKAELQAERDEKLARARWWDDAEIVLTYKEQVISLHPVENGLSPAYRGFIRLTGVPTGKIINLDKWVAYLTSKQAKSFKRMFRPYVKTT